MSFIRTVLGDIAPEALGVCYAHEHVIIDPGYMTTEHPDFLLDSVDNAVSELAQFHADGGRAMVDSMPAGGRNAAKLAEVSRRTGVHLVCPTGLHLARYYAPDHWSRLDDRGGFWDSSRLADWFVSEIEEGIDPHDTGDPKAAGRLPHRAGIIKVAGESERLDTDREYAIFWAAAKAHQRTGCPILTHTEQGKGAGNQVILLGNYGIDLTHVVLSHTDRQPDAAAHRRLLASGVNVEFDSAFRWKDRKTNPTLDLLRALFDEFPNQLMLGMDAARRSYWRSYGGGPGLSHLLTEFAPLLTPMMREQIFVTNPARAYAFSHPR